MALGSLEDEGRGHKAVMYWAYLFVWQWAYLVASYTASMLGEGCVIHHRPWLLKG